MSQNGRFDFSGALDGLLYSSIITKLAGYAINREDTEELTVGIVSNGEMLTYTIPSVPYTATGTYSITNQWERYFNATAAIVADNLEEGREVFRYRWIDAIVHSEVERRDREYRETKHLYEEE